MISLQVHHSLVERGILGDWQVLSGVHLLLGAALLRIEGLMNLRLGGLAGSDVMRGPRGLRHLTLRPATLTTVLLLLFLLGSSGLRLRADGLREELLGQLGLLVLEQEARIHDRYCLRPAPIDRLVNDLGLLLLHNRKTARPILEHLFQRVPLVLERVAISKAAIPRKRLERVMG